MGDVLPLEMLRNVKDLSLMLRYMEHHEPQWPDSWDQLTGVTRLELECRGLSPSLSDAFVLFPFKLKGLIDIKLTTTCNHFFVWGNDHLLALIGCYPRLSRL